ncbi:MAG TPA: hypothetical protein VF470_06085 [Sphingomicrobium sp.]
MPIGLDRLFEIYLSLDDAYLRDAMPSLRTYAQIGELIDDLRSSDPFSEFLTLAEGLLVTIHRLQPALGGGPDCSHLQKTRYQLKQLCDEWLRACPLAAATWPPEARCLVLAA